MAKPDSTKQTYDGLPPEWLNWTLKKQDEFASEQADLFIEIAEDYDRSAHKVPFLYRDIAERHNIELPPDDADDDEIEEWVNEIKADYPSELLEDAVSLVRERLLYRREAMVDQLRTLEAEYPNRTSRNLLAHYKEHELMLRGQKQFWPNGMSAAARGNASDEIKRGVAQSHINSLFAALYEA